MEQDLQKKINDLEVRLAKIERMIVVTPTLTTLNGNVRIPGTLHADRLYRRGNTGNYTEVTT